LKTGFPSKTVEALFHKEHIMPKRIQLDRDEILEAEFNYIANTAFQANEDRARFTTFYFVTAGSFVAAIFGTQFEQQRENVSLGFFFLFIILTIMGALTISQLARLRAAWHESVEAMNQIKDFYIEHHPEIAQAFKWRGRTIPPTNKPCSIANLIAVEVALLSSLTTGAAVYFLLSFFGAVTFAGWALIAAGFFAGCLLQWGLYKRLLVDDR
jgi:hypothetical protein